MDLQALTVTMLFWQRTVATPIDKQSFLRMGHLNYLIRIFFRFANIHTFYAAG